MSYVLFTECLQNDFVAPLGAHERLPNALHIGRKESARLLGNPGGAWATEGPLARFLASWAAKAGAGHAAIHIRDWHDPADTATQPHLTHFGAHCLKDSSGARFVAPLESTIASGGNHHVVDSAILSDFVDTTLEATLRQRVPPGQPARVGIIGVWTDVKVRYLAYDLMARLGWTEVAICGALTASNSQIHHREALEHLQSALGVQVYESIPDFLGWMGIDASVAPVVTASRPVPRVTTSGEMPLAEEERRLVEFLFRDCAEVLLKPLGGGFSGSKVFLSASTDRRGLEEVPFVVKIDTHAKIAKERAAVESVENVLGSVAPRLAEYVDLETLGAIKYQFATMHAGLVSTLKKAVERADDAQTVQNHVAGLADRVLRRLYQKPLADRHNLVRYYNHQPDYGEKSLARAADWGAVRRDAGVTVPGVPGVLPDPAVFYRLVPGLLAAEPDEVPCCWIHGDLNLANVLLDDSGNTWMIDYFWTRVGHALQDIAKLENDLKFILVPLPDDAALSRAVAWERLLLSQDDLTQAPPALPAELATDPAINKAHAAISILRGLGGSLLREAGFTGPVPPWQYHLAQLRYSAHTLTFDECDERQRRFAFASTCLLAERLAGWYGTGGR